jgi:Transposase IS66 family
MRWGLQADATVPEPACRCGRKRGRRRFAARRVRVCPAGSSAGSCSTTATRSPPARWPGSTRPGSGSRAGCTGCTAPALASTRCSWSTRSTAPRRWRRWVLPAFAGVAVHDAWAPYDTCTGPDHQLCCAHALRELQAVTDVAPDGQWCWATQAAGALTAMQDLVREAISQGHHAADPVR